MRVFGPVLALELELGPWPVLAPWPAPAPLSFVGMGDEAGEPVKEAGRNPVEPQQEQQQQAHAARPVARPVAVVPSPRCACLLVQHHPLLALLLLFFLSWLDQAPKGILTFQFLLCGHFCACFRLPFQASGFQMDHSVHLIAPRKIQTHILTKDFGFAFSCPSSFLLSSFFAPGLGWLSR